MQKLVRYGSFVQLEDEAEKNDVLRELRPYSQELKSLYVDDGLRRRDGWARQTLP